jgi:hypothetical protein
MYYMKFERWSEFFLLKLDTSLSYIKKIAKFFNPFYYNCWLFGNQADRYWWTFSNKKTFYESKSKSKYKNF